MITNFIHYNSCWSSVFALFYPANLKQKIVRLLNLIVRNHSCGETIKVVKFLSYRLKNLKLCFKTFCSSILHINRKQAQKFTKVSIKIQLIKRLRQKLSFFFCWRNSNCWRSFVLVELKQEKIHTSLQEGIFWDHHLLFILKGHFQKLVTCTNKCEIDWFKKPAKNCYFSPQLEKTIIGTFVD